MTKKYHVCTFFNRYYLFKGLAQYYSLVKTSTNFTWWVLCMDDKVYEILSRMQLKGVRLIRLVDIENDDLLEAKSDRTETEYCWTIKPSLIDYIFSKYKEVKELLYLDSDIYFFSDIKQVYSLTSKYQIAVAPHNFPKTMKSRVSDTGKFNAGVVYFKRKNEGLKCLKRWKQQCIDWCYFRLEDGKLGDQMYLDEWPKKYKSLLEFKHVGINLAPWNVGDHKISKPKDRGVKVDQSPLIFYHFHQFKLKGVNEFDRSYGYSIPKEAGQIIYRRYESEIKKAIKNVRLQDHGFNYGIEESNLKKSVRGLAIKTLAPVVWRLKSLLTRT